MTRAQEASEAPLLVNGRPHPLPGRAGECTVATLLESLGGDLETVAVEVNGEVVPRRRHGETVLRPGDRVEVVRLVGGG